MPDDQPNSFVTRPVLVLLLIATTWLFGYTHGWQRGLGSARAAGLSSDGDTIRIYLRPGAMVQSEPATAPSKAPACRNEE